jgi:glycosyltransferase involved in cell wall biosynthesis
MTGKAPRRLRIAFLGIRGVPANYGGFETFVEQLGSRLAERGHEVTVYGRDRYVDRSLREYRGMRLIRLPAPRSKYLETVVHSLFAAIHSLRHRHDIVYICNSANVPAAVVLALGRRHVVLNVDGLEWKRAKWNAIGRRYYQVCEWLAARLPVHVVTDAAVIAGHYATAHGRVIPWFPYGADLEAAPDDGTLARLGVEPRSYVLYVSRLEPENNAHVVIEAWSKLPDDIPILIVGDAPYASDYIAGLHATTDPRVRFTGAIYGEGYRILQSHSLLYVQATEVGGTHPALVEAMGYGAAILANDVPEHREALADAGAYYEGVDGLADRLRALLDDPGRLDEMRSASTARAREIYGWDAITDAYEAWFRTLTKGERS